VTAAVTSATARISAIAAALRLTAMPEPMPLVWPCMLISRGAITRPATTPPVTPSAVRIMVLTTRVAITWRGVSPMAASTPTSCRWSRIPTTVAVSRFASPITARMTTETAITTCTTRSSLAGLVTTCTSSWLLDSASSLVRAAAGDTPGFRTRL